MSAAFRRAISIDEDGLREGAAHPDRSPASLELELPTGRVPLGFVEEGDRIYLVGRDRAARWPVVILREGSATVRIAGRTVHGTVDLITDPEEKRRVLSLFEGRYGTPRFLRWYSNPARVLVVRPSEAPRPRDPGDRYYDWLGAEFDNVATDYDHHITDNRINRLLRDRSLLELRRAFRSAPRLLEIGCGSGMETLPLLEEGHEMVCVDISSRMLDVVREKARRSGVSERVTTRRMAASQLPQLLREFGSAAFDGAYSTYGALNCEPDLGFLPQALADLLRPGSRFVAGVYNRWCLFELAGYGLTGRWSRALGRTRRPVPVGSSRFCVDIFALSPGDFARLLEGRFRVERVEGVPVLLPPSDLVGYTDVFSPRFKSLARLDRGIGRRWPFSWLGDHFLMTLARRDGLAGRDPLPRL